MLRTIRGRIIVLQTLIIIAVIVGLFVVFSIFADNYYYNRKLETIQRAYNTLDKASIESLEKDNSLISSFEDERLTFIICNSSFQRVYVTKLEKKPIDAQAQIKNDIVKKLGNFSYTYRKKETKDRIYGHGIINQYGEDYYVYIYENKDTSRIFFSYYRIFFIILGAIILIVAIIVSLYVSKKVSRPIEEIDRAASNAISSGYTLPVSNRQSFKETESLANSINNMLYQIRLQMSDLEDELVRKSKTENERRIFINNVSHELKTPLAIITNQIEMLRFINDEEKRLEYIDSIEEETLKMTDMINDMIVMYATQSDETEFSIEDVDIAELMQETIGQYENLITKNGIVLVQENDDNCVARVNKRYISQAVGNYITNAIKHCYSGGRIITRVINDGPYVRIEVENDGDPVDDKYKDRIWESFFSKDDNITLNGQKNSGIGLAIVKTVMKVHNGEYGFDNLDGSVKFWMKIPNRIVDIY